MIFFPVKITTTENKILNKTADKSIHQQIPTTAVSNKREFRILNKFVQPNMKIKLKRSC